MNRPANYRRPIAEIITHFHFTPCSDAGGGLLGFVRFRIAGLFFADGIAVRRTREGRISLKFPNKKARDGRLHNSLRPIDNTTRTEIEQFVVAKLRETGDCPLANAAEPST